MSLPEGLADYVSILEHFGAYEVSAMELYGDVFKLGTGFLRRSGWSPFLIPEGVQ